MVRFITASAFLFSIILCSCGSSKNLTGTYYSKFAVHQRLVTTIKLRPDSTLEFVSKGDGMMDSATGRWQVYEDRVYVRFDEAVLDIENGLSSSSARMPVKKIVVSGDTVRYQQYFYIGRNKLFPAHFETGKKVTKAWGYSKSKKFLLLGSHYFNRRYYLQRLD